MYTEISKSDFHSAFHRMDRGEQFSYEALDALYDYLIQIEEDIGEKIELDVIALCCEYTEYADCIEVASKYFEFEWMTFWEDWEELKTSEEVEEEAKEFLRDRTTLIEFDGGIIISNF